MSEQPSRLIPVPPEASPLKVAQLPSVRPLARAGPQVPMLRAGDPLLAQLSPWQRGLRRNAPRFGGLRRIWRGLRPDESER